MQECIAAKLYMSNQQVVVTHLRRNIKVWICMYYINRSSKTYKLNNGAARYRVLQGLEVHHLSTSLFL